MHSKSNILEDAIMTLTRINNIINVISLFLTVILITSNWVKSLSSYLSTKKVKSKR